MTCWTALDAADDLVLVAVQSPSTPVHVLLLRAAEEHGQLLVSERPVLPLTSNGTTRSRIAPSTNVAVHVPLSAGQVTAGPAPFVADLATAPGDGARRR